MRRAGSSRPLTRRAFTYIELLVALSLFFLGMVSVLQVFPLNRKYLNQSAHTSQAIFLAQEQVEKIRALPYTSVTPGTFEPRAAVGSGGTDPMNQFERQTVVQLINSTYAPSATDVGLKRVSVTVFWIDNGSVNRSTTINTFVYQ
jgi:type II secretory pathway pseudopilin PulG